MSRYSRLFLHFLHAVTSDRDRVTTFLFGTRLTNITRDLKAPRHRRFAGPGLEACAGLVRRHAHRPLPRRFQQEMGPPRAWARVPSVLLITDGLDREAIDVLEQEMERLHKSCRRLIWLNPAAAL